MKVAKNILVILFLLSLFVPSRFVRADIRNQSTLAPIITSSFTITPFRTPSITRTHTPSATPIVVTVIHTKIVTRFAPTLTPTATGTNTVTVEAASTGNDEAGDVPIAPYTVAIVGMIATFIAGIVVAAIWARIMKK